LTISGSKAASRKSFATLDKKPALYQSCQEVAVLVQAIRHCSHALCRSASSLAVWQGPLVPDDFYRHVLAPWTFKCALVVIRAIRLNRSQPHLCVAKLARGIANDLLVRKELIRSHAHTYCFKQAGKQGSSAAREPEENAP
jgi:hypothetical protein